MIDFANIKSMAIPQGNVKMLRINGVMVWQSGASEPDVPDVPAYTNRVPLSTDTDGSIYNGTGYKDNARLSSSGGVSGSAQNGSVTTGFIPYSATDVVRMYGVEWLGATANYGGHFYINFYDSSKKFKTYVSAQAYVGNYDHVIFITRDENGVETIITNAEYGSSNSFLNLVRQSSYIRITARGKGADMIVTVNEEIV